MTEEQRNLLAIARKVVDSFDPFASAWEMREPDGPIPGEGLYYDLKAAVEAVEAGHGDDADDDIPQKPRDQLTEDDVAKMAEAASVAIDDRVLQGQDGFFALQQDLREMIRRRYLSR